MKKLWMEDRIIRNNIFNFHLKSHLCDEMDVKERLIVQNYEMASKMLIDIYMIVIMWYYVNLRMSWLATHF